MISHSIRRLKSWAASIWTPVGGGRSGSGFGFAADIYGEHADPTTAELLGAYSDVAYACVRLISQSVAGVELKLVATTRPGDRSPTSFTRSLSRRAVQAIRKNYPAWSRKAAHVEEVVDHPLLDLLDRPNPVMSGTDLIGTTVCSLELCGVAYWSVSQEAIWLLPAHTVAPEYDDLGHVVGYIQHAGTEGEVRYAPDQVIHFKSTNPLDPYAAAGVSPLMSVWQRVLIGRQELSSWQAVLSNMAVPSALVGPPPGETFTTAQADRLTKSLYERFGLGRQGGIWVQTDPFVYTPVSTPPKDLTSLQVYDQIKTAICNAYGVPRQLLDLQDSNYASAETARRSFEQYALKPRVLAIIDTLNRHWISRYSDRLHLATDEVVRPDQTVLLQETAQLVGGNVITINEGRIRHGYDPLPGMDRLASQVVGGGLGTPAALTGGKSIRKSIDPGAGQMAGVLRTLFRKLQADVMARVTENIQSKSFIPAAEWTEEIARQCSPFLRLAFQGGADSMIAQLGGDPSMRLLAVPKLSDAVQQAALAFAESTLQTTNLEVDAAVAEVRRELQQGLPRGEANRKITEKIEGIFSDLSERRSYLIAETESARARHAGEVLMAKESGLTVRKKWIADGLACPTCSTLDGRIVGLEEPFADDGRSGPYSRIDHPPAHPACRCSQGYEVSD